MKDSWGGPFNGQSFRCEMFRDLIRQFKFKAIVETGTYRGTTTEYLRDNSGLPIFTTEVSPRYYGYSRARFMMTRGVNIFHAESNAFLNAFASRYDYRSRHVFFYLDAHWGDDLPLKNEIQFIFENFLHAVVMVDDFKVPNDEGYGYDDYGENKIICLDLLSPLVTTLSLAVFFPSAKSETETGFKRGCVVLSRDPEIVSSLKNMRTLTLYSGDSR